MTTTGPGDVALVVGLFPWDDRRVAMPMSHTARVCAYRPNTVVFYIDAEWPAAPGVRWRHAVQRRTPPRLWRILPDAGRSSIPDAARFRDVAGVPVSPREMLDAMDEGRVVLWANSFWPDQCQRLARTMSPDAVVYDCHETAAYDQSGAHVDLLDRADVVLAISEAVAAAVARHPKVLTLGNGIEAERFIEAPPRPARWTFGFVGNFLPWIDTDALESLADAFPDESVLLVGPVEDDAYDDYRRLSAHPNVTAKRPIPYEEVPDLLQEIEVCLLPRRLNPASLASDPLKLYEYLAAGRPVVSTALPSAEALRNVVYLADPGRAFVDAARLALEEARSGRFRAEKALKGQEAVASRTWQSRVEAAWRAVDEVLLESGDRRSRRQ